MTLRATIGGRHQADVTKEWQGDFAGFVKAILARVPISDDKASAGWVCGAHFKPAYRHSENYQARYFLSLDYDHITPEDQARILDCFKGTAFLAYTTWSHHPDHPRIRVWIPLSRPSSAEEFQAVSRKVAARCNIELAARESHTPCQYMYRPAQKDGIPFQHWEDTEGPYLDVDKVLGEYSDWQDRSLWPRRSDGDELYDSRNAESPLAKGGLVGAFCRAFRITEAIERFSLPYRPGSNESRWTYTGGSRADGAVIYDDDTKLHSHHDTDPARGQHNAYDLVRLHRFGTQDTFDGDTSIALRPSTRSMESFCRELPELREHFASTDSAGFTPLPEPGSGEPSDRASRDLPDEIAVAKSLCSDLENARRIQRAFSRQVISVAETFYIWEETHWKCDLYQGHIARRISQVAGIIRNDAASFREKCKAEDRWNETTQEAYAKMYAFSLKCEDKGRMDACRELVRKLLIFDADKLNTHKHLFNARNCTIDLKTGETYPHRAEDFMTECAPTDYDPAAKCPRFEQFMLEIFDGDEKVVAFMKRWLGYCLTGETREHSLVFHVGKSGNGKSTLISTVGHVLGKYATIGPSTLLTGQAQIKNDIASLVGKRMVTVSETKQNEDFDQAQLKQLTGGDTLNARFLHKEFFEFRPSHKLQIFTNHEPSFTGDDGGMWRRLLLVRYKIRYGTPEQVESGEYQKVRDEGLEDTLKAEAPGILRWLVEGAREWYSIGLRPPLPVLKATADLQAQQDILAQFLKERTELDPKGRVPYSNCTESLYTAYKGWIAENGQRPYGRNKFLRHMRDALPQLKEVRWEERGEWFRGLAGIRLVHGNALS